MRQLMLALFIFLSSVISANAYCYEPQKPYCVAIPMPFTSQYDAQACNVELQSYLTSIQNYISCVDNRVIELRMEAEEATDSFRLRIKKTIK